MVATAHKMNPCEFLNSSKFIPECSVRMTPAPRHGRQTGCTVHLREAVVTAPTRANALGLMASQMKKRALDFATAS